MLSRLVDHKPSILQDYEQNRQMEIAEILLAPLAFARATSVATPTLDIFAALAKNLAAERGLASA
jgi:2-dehydropantoate 2-reductase